MNSPRVLGTELLWEGSREKAFNHVLNKQAQRHDVDMNWVRRILNLASNSWRDENDNAWLQQAPKITLLPLVGHQCEPQPINWADQRRLLPKLPDLTTCHGCRCSY